MKTILEAIITFVSTNVDEFFILIALYLQVGINLKRSNIIIGQYIGLTTLILISILGSLGTKLILDKYFPFLGIIPILIGIKGLVVYLKNKKDNSFDENELTFNKPQSSLKHIVRIALIFLVSGTDNISLYIPLFAKQSIPEIFLTILIFYIFLSFYNKLAETVSNIPGLKMSAQKYKDVLIPIIFIGLGAYIILSY